MFRFYGTSDCLECGSEVRYRFKSGFRQRRRKVREGVYGSRSRPWVTVAATVFTVVLQVLSNLQTLFFNCSFLKKKKNRTRCGSKTRHNDHIDHNHKIVLNYIYTLHLF